MASDDTLRSGDISFDDLSLDGHPTDTPRSSAGDTSNLAPRPRPSWRSRPAITPQDRAALLAAVVRGAVGVLTLFGSLLWLPAQPITPILAGVSILMIVGGATSTWKSGVREPRLARTARVFTWGMPIAALVVVALTGVLGAGHFGPTLRELTGRDRPTRAPTVHFEPAP